ncbi:hypothetical protein MALG_02385 [Marinovum algicola DG 898]|nr:hypothetical protein MALG_02385 [Marinovum algicola DG 898]
MMYRFFFGATALVVLAGCAELSAPFQQRERQADAPAGVSDTDGAPETAAAPPADAASEAAFDTTSAEERARAAAAPSEAGAQSLGTTVASLGDPTRSGFWLETPLVDAPAQGRVEYSETGKSAQVELIPIDGAATAGSRISLPAMRLLGAPLTGLVTLRVFRN